ncbi:hypothetical protein PPERSA_06061 [Pseudocohnilembus persalinus]|uniref:Cyclic nucleotide-binding protein n=1 Tax=Pseudocohnilembus persalinus TaxID=266149 RepID=A0A0V0QUT0_PSEPJ|nr:hypothetical protein PPERSA_06061 [Pseudocohnilembus persalinus]|eukprot:KRX06179.1 hypothetical protein PPERSA_06061 [Pseudocohnilembus persalinus]
MMGGGSQGETVYEITFSCLILLGTVAIFATILGTITVILEDIQRKGKDYNKEKETLNQFFKNQPQENFLKLYKIKFVPFDTILYAKPSNIFPLRFQISQVIHGYERTN